MKNISTDLVVLVVLVIVLFYFYTSEEIITGKIVSCTASKLHRHAELKRFLAVDALGYEGVEIEYVPHRSGTILTITKTDSRTGDIIGSPEEVKLHEIKSNELFHELFQEKGFQKKSEEEIARIKHEGLLQLQRNDEERDRRFFDRYEKKIKTSKERMMTLKQEIQEKQSRGEDIEKDLELLERLNNELPELQQALDALKAASTKDDDEVKDEAQLKQEQEERDRKQLAKLVIRISNFRDIIERGDETGKDLGVIQEKLDLTIAEYEVLKEKIEILEEEKRKEMMAEL